MSIDYLQEDHCSDNFAVINYWLKENARELRRHQRQLELEDPDQCCYLSASESQLEATGP